jgi:glycosyltransferase involved in cell wall biosynthesis
MNLTLIITTYNWPEALILVLKSIKNQTIAPYEVIIADDGSGKETMDVISRFKKKSSFNVIHSWQEDDGFRVAKSRNKAIAQSTGDYIVLIDGDVLLHPKFLQDHLENSEIGYFVQGSRILLSAQETKNILHSNKIGFSFFSKGMKNRKNHIHSILLSKIFSKKKNYLQGIKSCNMAFFRQDCININGFNNEFNGWGREDTEFIVRLMNSNIIRKTLRFNAIQYHLWHPLSSKKPLKENELLLKSTIENNIKFCENGISSCLKEFK